MNATKTGDEWVKTGDRSHPHLKLIDKELMHQLTYLGYADDLSVLERAHLSGDEWDFDNALHKIRESQKLCGGDRSHRRIVQLDALRVQLTYDGWEKDCVEAKKEHLCYIHSHNFERMIEGIKRKQAIHYGDRTHKNLHLLDTICLSYPGWEVNVENALGWHKRGYEIDDELYFMRETQRMFEGDRSNPRLVALDSLGLTYPGWQEDASELEKKHLNGRFMDEGDVSDDFKAILTNLSRKQREFVTGIPDSTSMHHIQRIIVETNWTYHGWQKDVEEIKESCYVSLFENDLEMCQIKQMIHENDFGHHPALIKLGGMQLSYPGWKNDMKDIKKYLCEHGYELYKQRFDEKIQGIKNKQSVFNGIRRLKKKKGQERENQFGKCKICWDSSCTHAFVPCGHLCVCEQCSQYLTDRGSKCPICNQSVDMAMEVFLS